MPVLELPSARLRYDERGAGPALVFVHGMSGNHLSWWQQVGVFAGRYRCVSIDLPFFGESTWRPGHPCEGESYGDVILQCLDGLGIERAAYVAQSMGTSAAMTAALRSPGRCAAMLVGSSTGPIVAPEVGEARSRHASAIRESREAAERSGVHAALGPRAASEQPALSVLFQQVADLNPPLSPEQRTLVHDSSGELVDGPIEFPVPVAFVAGTEDIVVAPETIRAASLLVHSARYIEIERAGHSVYFERAEAFNDVLESLLREARW